MFDFDSPHAFGRRQKVKKCIAGGFAGLRP